MKNYVIDEKLYYQKYLIKGSKFICYLQYVDNKNDAENFIKKYQDYDASHNCYSYIIENEKTSKYFDDGEPSGTAGKAILDLLKQLHLTNIVVIVSRYFGGTLLGKNGLIKAYKQGPKNILSNLIKYQLVNYYQYQITFSYQNQKIIFNYLNKNHFKIINQTFNPLEINIVINIENDLLLKQLLQQKLISNYQLIKNILIKIK